MELPEYLIIIATKLETADKTEALRLIVLLRDTLNDAIIKLESS